MSICGETSPRSLLAEPGADNYEFMSATKNTTARIRSLRRAVAGVVFAAAVALAELGSVAAAHADTTVTNLGPSMHTPTHHPAFPHQNNMPQPGTRTHHHHQHRHG